jgi:Mn-dependent DtxR family transcriptional regulator
LTVADERRAAMRVSQSIHDLEHEYLRTLYELAGKKAKCAVSYGDVRSEAGLSEEETEKACDFWADRGIVEWSAFGHVALTHVGLRRAERLASREWCFGPF